MWSLLRQIIAWILLTAIAITLIGVMILAGIMVMLYNTALRKFTPTRSYLT
jgi:hypothetical protein